MATSLSPARKAIVDWVRSVTGNDARHVIWANQNQRRPTKPYIQLFLSAFAAPNHDFIPAPDGTGKSTLIGDREFTLGFMSFGTKNLATFDPLDPLLNIRSSVLAFAERKFLRDVELAFVDTLLPPTDVSEKIDQNFEARAAMDFLMRAAWELDDPNQGFINIVEIEGKYKNSAQIEIATNLITVTGP